MHRQKAGIMFSFVEFMLLKGYYEKVMSWKYVNNDNTHLTALLLQLNYFIEVPNDARAQR